MITRYFYRILYLKSKGWYRNMNGDMVSSHCMSILTKKQIFLYNKKQFKLYTYDY